MYESVVFDGIVLCVHICRHFFVRIQWGKSGTKVGGGEKACKKLTGAWHQRYVVSGAGSSTTGSCWGEAGEMRGGIGEECWEEAGGMRGGVSGACWGEAGRIRGGVNGE